MTEQQGRGKSGAKEREPTIGGQPGDYIERRPPAPIPARDMRSGAGEPRPAIIIGDPAVETDEWYLLASSKPVAPFLVVEAGSEEHARAALESMDPFAGDPRIPSQAAIDEREEIERRSREMRARLVAPLRQAQAVIHGGIRAVPPSDSGRASDELPRSAEDR